MNKRNEERERRQMNEATWRKERIKRKRRKMLERERILEE